MKKITSIITLGIFVFALSASFVFAAPQERVSAFVCPVFNSSAVGMHNPNTFEIYGGDYSLLPGKAGVHPGGPVSVPINATNGDGAGSPPGPHSGPGDTDYTAIWAN